MYDAYQTNINANFSASLSFLMQRASKKLKEIFENLTDLQEVINFDIENFLSYSNEETVEPEELDFMKKELEKWRNTAIEYSQSKFDYFYYFHF